MNGCKSLRLALRIMVLVMLIPFNLIATIAVAVFVLADKLNNWKTENAKVAQQVAYYLANNGIPLVVMSVIELLLLLDLNRYTKPSHNRK